MNLLPAQTVHLASDLPPAALADALRALIGAGLDAPFAGRVDTESFLITRMRDYRSAHLPVLRGRLAPAGGGTAVRLRLRAHPSVFWLAGIWSLFLAAFAGIIGAGHALNPARSLLLLLIPAGLAAFSWYLTVAVFAAEARWALRHLCEKAPLRR
jgi:hypothetical protein